LTGYQLPGYQPNDRVPLLFLAPDTGGGHLSAARAVMDAVELSYPGRFEPVLYDPLRGPGSPWVARHVSGHYGALTRQAPWAWGALYRASNSAGAVHILLRTLFAGTACAIEAAIEDVQPAIVVSFHALTTEPAVRAARRTPYRLPVITVVTDVASVHRAWREGEADCIAAPSGPVALRFLLDGVASDRVIETGLPVAAQLSSGPVFGRERAELRKALGLGEDAFVVVVTGGAEGTGSLGRQVRALMGCGLEDLEVVAICGRNRGVERTLRRLQARPGLARLIVEGFVDNMGDWLRGADVVVTRAGPGTLAEAMCAGAGLIITSHLPGQEEGNTELAVGAGAARHASHPGDVVREVERLHRNPLVLAAMRRASARASRPQAAAEVAALLAALSARAPDQRELLGTWVSVP
jgi:1,2-diacylglycerol 3-beta-galactosyltransferase